MITRAHHRTETHGSPEQSITKSIPENRLITADLQSDASYQRLRRRRMHGENTNRLA
jgi:hypothetical protein